MDAEWILMCTRCERIKTDLNIDFEIIADSGRNAKGIKSEHFGLTLSFSCDVRRRYVSNAVFRSNYNMVKIGIAQCAQYTVVSITISPHLHIIYERE